jgi:hypothetical protein
MMARAGPEKRQLELSVSAPIEGSNSVLPPTPASRLIPTRSPQSVTGNKRVKKPASKTAKKPPKSSGYFWRKDGAGWELRKDVYVTSHDGEKKRKQPYVADMSQEAFRELKKANKSPAALERAIAEWISQHDK